MRESERPQVTHLEIFKAAVQRLFGYDFFISYAWKDGRSYAEVLVRRLSLTPYGYRCFIDQKEMGGGEAWRVAVRKALRRSSVMVLVASPAALMSDNVFEEVRTFAARQRPLIPISFAGSIDHLGPAHRLYPFLEERLRVGEQEDLRPLELGLPADSVLTFLDSSFGFVRVSRWRTLLLTGAMLVFATIAGIATERSLAERSARALAEEQRDTAISNFFVSEAFRLSDSDFAGSLLRFLASIEVKDNVPARSGLLKAIQRDPHIAMTIIPAPGKITALTSDADGSQYAIGLEDGRVVIWQHRDDDQAGEGLPSSGLSEPWAPAPAGVAALRFLQDKDRLRGVDNAGHVLEWVVSDSGTTPRILDRLTQDEISRADFETPDVAMSVDGNTVAVATYGGVFLWRSGRGSTMIEASVQIGGPIALSPDGRRLASFYRASEEFPGVNSVGVLDLTTGTWRSIPDESDGGVLMSMAFGPSGGLLVIGRQHGVMELIDLNTGTLRLRPYPFAPANQRLNAGNEVAPLLVDPTGRYIALYYGRAWRLWDSEAALPLGAPIPAPRGAVLFAPRTQSLIVLMDEVSLRKWDFDLNTLRKWACINANSEITLNEWSAVAAPLPYRRVCAPTGESIKKLGRQSTPG